MAASQSEYCYPRLKQYKNKKRNQTSINQSNSNIKVFEANLLESIQEVAMFINDQLDKTIVEESIIDSLGYPKAIKQSIQIPEIVTTNHTNQQDQVRSTRANSKTNIK